MTGPQIHLTERSLHELAHLLPPSAVALVDAVGPVHALALIRQLPGVQLVVPNHCSANAAGARRWAMLAEVIGQQGMHDLAKAYGGQMLEVPTCIAARTEQRNRWLRQRFDEISAAGHTKATAVYELGLELAAAGWLVTHRQIERCIDQPDLTPELQQERQAQALQPLDSRQQPLFG